MNRKRVILWMTVAVAVILLTMTTVLLGAPPPWPVWLFFALSHSFFCAVVWQTRPYPGPFQDPMTEPTAPSDSKKDPAA
jgi:hypothetical protein